jgi:hypothetical protein
LKAVDVDPGLGDSQGAAGAAPPAGTEMITGLERKPALRSLFPNNRSISNANQLFASVSAPHHERAGARAADYGAGDISRVVASLSLARRLSASSIV